MPAASPSPRFRHAMAYHPAWGPVLYGGTSDGTTPLGDMWVWQNANWYQIAPFTMPPALQKPAMAWHGGQNPGLLLFGGMDAGGALSNETWLFDGTAWSWRSSSGPSARWHSAMAYAPTVQRSYLIGGSGAGTPGGETWAWDGATWAPATHPSYVLFGTYNFTGHSATWHQERGEIVVAGASQLNTWHAVPSATDPSSLHWSALFVLYHNAVGAACYDSTRRRAVYACWPTNQIPTMRVDELPQGPGWIYRNNATTTPPPRAYSDMAFDTSAGRTVIFGGWNGSNALADTWSFDGTAWTDHGASAVAPARVGTALCHLGGFGLVMFGGGTFSGAPFDDTLFWNGTDWQLAPMVGPSPPARMNHDVVNDSSNVRLVLFGGSNGTSFGDTWILKSTPQGLQWTQIALSGAQPPARNSHAMAFDGNRGRVVMFGGCGSAGQFLGDTWELNGGRWGQVFPAQSPPARWQHKMAYDVARQRVVLYGGYRNGVFLDDVWEYDGVTWTQRTSQTVVAPGREGAGFAYDPSLQRCVIHGGYSWASGFRNDTWFYNDP